MGKLVLFLADGTTLDVPLDRERITIGRRADNDVCLPYPAVSGEHAAVVTILADSFLEDLGSTNGTLVNGKPAQKHFLRDHDQIDIGRQRMTYMSDNDAKVDPLPADALRQQIRGLTDLVSPARVAPTLADRDKPRAPVISAANAPLLADLEQQMGADADGAPNAMPATASPSTPVARARAALRDGQENAGASIEGTVEPKPAAKPPVPATAEATTGAIPPSGTVAPSAAFVPATPAAPVIRVLSGPSLGRSMPMRRDELTVGRVGVQVALIRKVENGFRLVPVEGDQPPRINGAAVPVDGAPLHPGDTFEVAGVRLELSLPA